MTTINRSWLHGDYQGMAHEMAHQWFGDKVTCATFKDIWLNEGFATFSEAIYNESWGGEDWYRGTMQGKAKGYFGGQVHHVPIYDPSEDPGLLFNYATTYCKAGCVIHMLRRIVNNDTMFFNALKDYTDYFAYSNATTIQFRDYMSTRLGRNLDVFIDQWIFGTLHPVYNITWAQSPTNEMHIRVNQTQDEFESRDKFVMPIRFFAYRGNTVDTLEFMNDERSQFFRKQLAGTVDSVLFDSDLVIISERKVTFDATLGISTESPRTAFAVSLDAQTNEIVCRIQSEAPSIEIFNSLGERMMTRVLAPNERFIRISSNGLSAGAYFVRCGKEIGKFILVR